ncbi:hypothetical protein B0J11DRAFT_193886 [Dendryphion nanum]|uniref:HMG box domain-containing protein n=1 Tax=Dendryphion nanum TaxID=256645 RepID=A0A9P9D216_9PLEO|nr:hypothetical protein B0J11DRAFT_193886 [Dendryphion nanum]
MTNLALQLKRLGLLEYLDILIAEGFDTWDTVLDITGSDLNSLNVKINDQKRLQRAITKSRRWDQTERPTNARTKRKYTRRPKPDMHAPERPLTAYVAFSKHVRDILEGQEISFTDIAKVIGARWQGLPVYAREVYQCQANVAKEQYSVDLAEYKKSSKYHAYKEYLKGFKKNHNLNDRNSALEAQIKTSIPYSTHEDGHRKPTRVLGSAELGSSTAELDQVLLSPIMDLPRVCGYSYPSISTSSCNPTFSGPNSTHLTDLGSLVSTSPRPTTPNHRGLLASISYTSHGTRSIDLPLSQSFRGPTCGSGSLTLEGSGGYACASYADSSPLLNSPKLLQPMPILGPAPCPFGQPTQAHSPTQQAVGLCQFSPFLALIRAGELARITDARILKS